MATEVETAEPGSFSPTRHYYPRTLNAQLHPQVRSFLALGNERICARYLHLNPHVDPGTLKSVLKMQPRCFPWAGADLMHVTDATGRRRMVVIETNSSPSGQKSMPLFDEEDESGGYRQFVEHTMRPRFRGSGVQGGGLAVLYDKNVMEASGYAAAMADAFDEPVHLVPFHADDEDPPARFVNGVLEVRLSSGWQTIRGAHRYVTQRPWTRIPVRTKTRLTNPIIACLAGGRNKAMASKAYAFQNALLRSTGLKISTPRTLHDVRLEEVPLHVRAMGGCAVIKVPYSNAGQGVWTITSGEELAAFMALEQHYTRFVVQSLVGHHAWSSERPEGRFFHVGTVPDRRCRIFVADLRMMVCSTPDGFRPLAVYARRTAEPLTAQRSGDSWSMLGTNLSVKRPDGTWDSDTTRLVLMDRRDFARLGLGLDDLIEAYVQTVLSVAAIDLIARELLTQKGALRRKLIASMIDDPALLDEIPR